MTSAGSHTSKWTIAEVPAPPGLCLILSIRQATRHEKLDAEAGLVVDVRLGDAPFDAAYVIEGAPEWMVHAIVDHQVRQNILSLQPWNVGTTESTLGITLPDWIEDGERAALLVRTAARIGLLAAEVARRKIADVGPSETSGYRGLVAPATRARDREEVSTLLRMREQRADKDRKDVERAWLIAGVILAAVVAAVAILGR